MYENTQNLHQLCDLYVRKNKAKFFLRPAIQYFNEIWPVRKKVLPTLLYTLTTFPSFAETPRPDRT